MGLDKAIEETKYRMSAFATPSRHYPAKVHHVVASVLTDIAISFLARRPLLCHPQHAVSAQSLNYIHFYVSAVICTCSQDCHALNHSIIPPQLSLYMSLAPEQKLTYPLAGPAGPAAFNAGMAGFEAQSFRGLGVFTSTPVSFVLEPHIAHLNALEAFL